MADMRIMRSDFYNTQVATDVVPVANVDYDNFAVKNQFTVMLDSQIVRPCLAQNKFPMFVFNDAANKVGLSVTSVYRKQALELGIPAAELYNGNADSAVVNLLAYKGWFDSSIPLMTEIASVQWEKHGFQSAYRPDSAMDKCLFVDYLLSSGICYVEIFKDGIVDKFLATRNVNLLAQLSTAYKDDKTKEPYLRLNKELGTAAVRNGYTQYLSLTQAQIKAGSISYLKLSGPTKRNKTYNLAMPRGVYSQLRKGMAYRILPLWMLVQQNRCIHHLLQENLCTITYVKDNLQLRKIVTTKNMGVLSKIFAHDAARLTLCEQAFSVADYTQGMLKVPDLQLAGSESFLRALNMRICKLTVKPVTDAQGFVDGTLLTDISVMPDVVRAYISANNSNITYLQNVRYALECSMRKTGIDMLTREYQHYSGMAQRSAFAAQHKRVADNIAAEINAVWQEIKHSVDMSGAGKSAEQVYSDLLAYISTNLQQRTTGFYNVLCDLIDANPALFPNSKQVIASCSAAKIV